jgi:hypothetical protein
MRGLTSSCPLASNRRQSTMLSATLLLRNGWLHSLRSSMAWHMQENTVSIELHPGTCFSETLRRRAFGPECLDPPAHNLAGQSHMPHVLSL